MESGTQRTVNTVEVFDETPGYDEEVGARLAEGLTPQQCEQARLLYNIFNGFWGLCLVKGLPGTGKDLFGNYISYLIKTYFPHIRILRDEPPYALYGPYAGLFNDTVLATDLAKMRAVAKGGSIKQFDAELEKAADDWVANDGLVLLKNSVLYLTEFWKYCYKREAQNPMNKTMGGIHKMKRHINTLILGTTQLMSDLDRFTCKPFVDWQVTCVPNSKTEFTYFIHKATYNATRDRIELLGQPFPIPVDAGKPQSSLGDGKIRIRRPSYPPQTEEERIVLDVIKAGYDCYEDIVKLLATEGDMGERETLETLKELKFRKNKRAIDYPCWFGLWNSKSAPTLKTSLKMEE